MKATEKNAYILGTDREELWRLGYQHQVWSGEARKSWDLANFKMGDTLLDLGCGPGYCTQELGYIVGPQGRVIAVDKSESYIKFLDELTALHQLPIETRLSDFDDLKLEPNSLDGAYCRWAMAWIPNAEEIIKKVIKALKPGGKFVLQEYYDWSTLQTNPKFPNLAEGIFQALSSFDNGQGEINIGRDLADIFLRNGCTIHNSRPMNKMARPGDLIWNWPKTFFRIYFPKVVEMGKLDNATVEKAMLEFDELEKNPAATIFTPSMIEVIGAKR